MRAILTIAREDGSFPDVGMTGRTVTKPTTALGVQRRALNFAKGYGRAVRVEEFDDASIYGEPYRVWIQEAPPTEADVRLRLLGRAQ